MDMVPDYFCVLTDKISKIKNSITFSLINNKNNYLCICFIKQAGIAQLVEHDLAKVGVAGPSPVSRSNDS